MLFGKKEEGEINMPNIHLQNRSLKVSWVQRFMTQPTSNWAKLAISLLPPGGTVIFNANCSKTDLRSIVGYSPNTFWFDVLDAWAELNFKGNINVEEADDQQIWYNSHIKIQGRLILING